MAYNTHLADRIREQLAQIPNLAFEEKKLFSGLTFMVQNKMCISVSGENLMCRFDPDKYEEVAERTGFLPMRMKGKTLHGYCYVAPEGFNTNTDFWYLLQLCLAYNANAKASKK